jgi:hypothetical protein
MWHNQGERRVVDREDAFFKMRLPADLHDRLKRSAVQNRRNMSQEIVARLEATYGNDVEDGEWRYAHMDMDRPPPPPARPPEPEQRSPAFEAIVMDLLNRMAAMEATIARQRRETDEEIKKPASTRARKTKE